MASCLTFVMLLSLPPFILAQEEEVPTKRGFDSLQKSLLFPGWGQLAEKKYLRGITFISAEIACLYAVFANNHRGNENYRLYQAAENAEDAVKYRDLTEKYDRRRNLYLLAAVGVWAVNLVDIYVLIRKKERTNDALRIELVTGASSFIKLTLSYDF